MSDDSEDKPYPALREAEDLAKLENTPFPHRFMCHCFKCQRPFIDCSGCKAASRYKQLRKVPEAFAAEALALPPPEYACYPCTMNYTDDDYADKTDVILDCLSGDIYCVNHDDPDEPRPKHVSVLMGMGVSPLGLGALPKVIQHFLDIGRPLLPETSFLRGCEFLRLTATCRAARFDVSLRNLIKYYNILWQHWHAMPGEYCYYRKTELCKKHLWPLIA